LEKKLGSFYANLAVSKDLGHEVINSGGADHVEYPNVAKMMFKREARRSLKE
jgi:hypothetical protein